MTGEPLEPVLDTILRVAAASGARPAVRDRARALAYAELVVETKHLAAQLEARGVGRGDIVGVCLDRSLDVVVAMLATLWVGAAWVPLDPLHPRARRVALAERSGARIVVTSRSLSALHESTPLLVLEDASAWESLPGPHVSDLGAAAYLLYTSGSTGVPKGVVVEHAALANVLCSMRHTPGITRDDVVLAVTSPSFDISVLELLLPLTVGASIVVASSDEVADGALLVALAERSGATWIQATPITWRLLLDGGFRGEGRVRALCGGEALRADLARRLHAASASLWSMYGPTETTIWSLVHEVRAPVRDGIEPLGQAIDETSLRVVEDGRDLGDDAVGELWIAGRGLARGYHGDPERTAERFVSDAAGTRWYRTGDRVRRRSDGVFDFVGRNDTQVKVHGHRIELGEIEAVLARHATVHEAVVIVREDAPNDPRLVAYVRLRRPEVSSAEHARALQRFVADALPAYMVPRHVVFIEHWPTTAHAKIDRAALAPPHVGDVEVASVEAADGEPADWLTRLARAALGRSSLGGSDAFFEHGVDSLALAALVAALRTRGVVVAMADVHRAGSVDALRGLVPVDEPAHAAATVPPDVPAIVGVVAGDAGTERAYRLNLGQHFALLASLLNAGTPMLNDRLVFTVRGPFDPACFAHALRVVAERNDVLRSCFRVQGLPEPMQVVHARAQLSIVHHDASASSLAAFDVAQADLERSRLFEAFDLARPELVRLDTVCAPDGSHRCIVVVHSSILDGWSVAALVRALWSTYRALREGRDPPPASWWMGEDPGTDGETSKRFWDPYLRGFREPSLIAPFGVAEGLPFTRLGRRLATAVAGGLRNVGTQPALRAFLARDMKTWIRGAFDSPSAALAPSNVLGGLASLAFVGNESLTVDVSPELERRLTRAAQDLGMTRGGLFTAGLALVMMKTLRRRDVVVRLVVANRLGVNDADALGCLARGLPLRVTAKSGDSLRAFLSEHQATLVRLLDHQSDDPVPHLEAAEPITDVAYTELPWDASTACPPELSIGGVRQLALNYNPLNLVWTPHATHALELVYRAPPFDAGKVHALRDAFVAILATLTTADDARVDDVL